MASNNLLKVTLPSKGLLYDNIPGEITLISMSVKEEKMIFGSSSGDAVDRVLKKCIVDNFPLSELLSADEHFLLMQLRIHTFGSDYRAIGRCSDCNKKSEFDVNLDDLLIEYLPDDFEEPILIDKLPVSEDIIKAKLLRNYDSEFVGRQAKKLSKSLNLQEGEIEYILRMAKMITHINGEEVAFGEAQKYVENMHSRDSAYFWHIIDSISFGYDPTVNVTCPKCGEEFEFLLPMNREFFRPKFR